MRVSQESEMLLFLDNFLMYLDEEKFIMFAYKTKFHSAFWWNKFIILE